MQAVIHTILSGQRAVTVVVPDLEAAVRGQMGAEPYADEGGYPAFAAAVEALIAAGELRPIKAAGTNGRYPVLPARCRRVSPADEVDTGFLRPLHPGIRTDAYAGKPNQALRDRPYLLALDAWLRRPDRPALVAEPWSINERSLQVFGDEKFLREAGEAFLRRVGLDVADLCVIRPSVPLCTAERYRMTLDRVLVVENLDTFDSLRRAFRARPWLGGPVDMLIFGAGNAFAGLAGQLMEMQGYNEGTVVDYFGDIDAEGLLILARAVSAFPALRLRPNESLYQALLHRGIARPTPPWDAATAPDCFAPALAAQIQAVAEAGFWYPQEGLGTPFFKEAAIGVGTAV